MYSVKIMFYVPMYCANFSSLWKSLHCLILSYFLLCFFLLYYHLPSSRLFFLPSPSFLFLCIWGSLPPLSLFPPSLSLSLLCIHVSSLFPLSFFFYLYFINDLLYFFICHFFLLPRKKKKYKKIEKDYWMKRRYKER